ncbi:MAG: DsbA family oxidoreductase [Pseudomonadota bacterium]
MNKVMDALPLHIDIVSDVVCPWCIVGYKQLQLGLSELEGEFRTEVRWRPFELNPQMPTEGQEIGEHLAQKYGGDEQYLDQLSERLSGLGERLGFKLSFSRGMRIYNTFRAHQLLHWAQSENCQTALKLALFEAYFGRGENISDVSVLASVANSVGLDASVAEELLATGRYQDDVRKAQQESIEKDVHAVPTFFFNSGYSVPGAQEAGTFARVLKRILQKERAEES